MITVHKLRIKSKYIYRNKEGWSLDIRNTGRDFHIYYYAPDKEHGGSDCALSFLQNMRDMVIKSIWDEGMNASYLKAHIRTKKNPNSNDTSLPVGVNLGQYTYINNKNNEATSYFFIAIHPDIRNNKKKKRFPYVPYILPLRAKNQRREGEALFLAIEQRLKWENEHRQKVLEESGLFEDD